VKVWTTMKTGTTAAHTRSIAQAGKGIDGGYADLFTAEDRVVDRQGCAQRSQDDPHQFRMIISLVEGAPLDLQAYTRAYMAQMARDVGGEARVDRGDPPGYGSCAYACDDSGA
jgi:type IV secretory pathway VirD2 relaxase